MASQLVRSKQIGNERKIKLDILMMVMGTRGDSQPILEIGKLLKFRHGHNVRVATHPRHRKQVEEAGLEFHSIGGGDPADFLAFRIQNFKDQLKGRHGMLANMRIMGEGYWKACIGSSDGLSDDSLRRPFVADVIISTPPCFPNISCASRLGIPLHIISANPWSPTKYLPHCLAAWCSGGNYKSMNLLSYLVFNWRFFLPLKDILNDLRLDWMGLESFSFLWALSQISRMQIPHTYLWSSAFIPRPMDWGKHIDVAGYAMSDEPSYTPPQALAKFLDEGETPIYVGFGSSKLPHADELTTTIFQGINKAGVRAVFCKGWSSLGSASQNQENIHVVDDVPHEWLFSRVSAVVYHGGAGTTAMALKHGKPAVIVSIYGDSAFWGSRIASAKVGIAPIAYKDLTADRLADAINKVLHPKYTTAAGELAKKVELDFNGVENSVQSILRTLSLYNSYRCTMLRDLPAVWNHKDSGLRLSTVAAYILLKKGKIELKNLELLYPVKWPDFTSPGDPVTGAISSLMHVVGHISRDAQRIGAAFMKNRTQEIELSQKKVAITAGSSNSVVQEALLIFILHIVRAPLSLFVALTFGLYNLLDFLCYLLESRFKPEGFANNPRLHTYPHMMSFLLLRFLCELAAAFIRPWQTALNSDTIVPTMIEVPRGIARALISGLNVGVGVIALTLRALDSRVSKSMNEQPKEDVVFETRSTHGKLEFERLAKQAADGGSELREFVTQAWEASLETSGAA